MPSNDNPESTWGKTEAQKAVWRKKHSKEDDEKKVSRSKPTELSSSTPESTWGKSVKDKLEYFETNVPNFDPSNPVGKPTKIGRPDEDFAADRPETKNTLDAGPVTSTNNEPDVYEPIYAQDTPVDSEPTPGTTEPAPEPTEPTAPPVEYTDAAATPPEYTDTVPPEQTDLGGESQPGPQEPGASTEGESQPGPAPQEPETTESEPAASGSAEGGGITEDMSVEQQ